MKKLFNILVAVAILITSTLAIDSPAYAESEWNNAVKATLNILAESSYNTESDEAAYFVFTAPDNNYYDFVASVKEEGSSSNGYTNIDIYNGADEYCYNESVNYGENELYIVKCKKDAVYRVKIYDAEYHYDEAIINVGLKVTAHKHNLIKSIFPKATINYDGNITYECSNCTYESETVIPRIKTVKLKTDEYTYNGKAKKPNVTVTDRKGNNLKNNIDYTIAYKSNKQAGIGKVIVKFKGNYEGSKTKNFYIFPKTLQIKKLTAEKNTFTVKWKVQPKGVNGYEIQYSKKKSFKGKKTVYAEGRKKAKKKIKNLSYDTKYYVRIRAYSETNSGTLLVSDWSKTKTVKTKAEPKPKETPSSGSGGGNGGSGGGSSYSGHVYITPTGTKYHFSASCAGKNATEVSMDYAKTYYSPCKKCAGG